jgi:hypothetical protein
VAQEIREFAVTVPPNTAKVNAVTTNISFPDRVVTSLSWRVPPGPSGLMGWALTSAGAPVIPIQPGSYMVTDNQADTWNLEGYLDSGNWQVQAYNTGIYPHTVYLTFQLDLPGTASAPVPLPTGTGVGVVGITGVVPVSPSPPPPAGSSSPPPTDDPAAVVTAVLAAMLAQGR